MHFRDHQEYLRFFRQKPVEPKEYQPKEAAPVEEPKAEAEAEEPKKKGRRRKDG